MDRKKLEQLIFDTCSVEPDYPWMDTPESAGFQQHPPGQPQMVCAGHYGVPKQAGAARAAAGGHRKPEMCPLLIGSLRMEPGFYPAYHMNKDNWITAALDGSAPDDTIRMLLEMSYAATAPKLRKKPWSSAACPLP